MITPDTVNAGRNHRAAGHDADDAALHQRAPGPGRGFAGGGGLLLAGLVALSWAVADPGWVAAASAVGAGVGLWLLNREVVALWFGPSWHNEVLANPSLPALGASPVWWRRAGPTLGLLALALIGAWAAITTAAPVVLVALVLAAGATALAPLAVATRVAAGYHPRASVVAGLAVLATGLAALAFGQALSVLLPLIGVAVAMAGLGLYKSGLAGLRGGPRSQPPSGLAAASAVAAAVFSVGVLAMVWAVREAAPVVGAAGSVLIFLSLTALAVTWPAQSLAPLGRRTVAIVGVLFLLAAVFVNWSTGLGDLPSWLLTAAIAGFGWSIVQRGEAVVLGVLVGFVVIWSLVDRTAVVDQTVVDQTVVQAAAGTGAAPGADGDRGRIVAFGDSYMSGEGAPAFLPGTNQVGPNRNECRRAPTAYPHLVADDLGLDLDFYACSGARTRDIIGDTLMSMPAGGTTGVDASCPGLGQMPCSPEGVVGANLQIDNLPPDRSAIQVALVSIGGNDVRFSQIASGCLLPGSCDELRELWLGNVEILGPSLQAVYLRIKEELPGVPVVAMPYPLIITEASCDHAQLTPGEHEFIYEFLTVLNEQVRTSAAQAGVHFFEPGMFAFDGRRICDEPSSEIATNFISLAPPGGGFFERLDPRTWVHNSMHPKPSGHALTATALAPFVAEVIDNAERNPEQANPVPNTAKVFTIRGFRGARPLPVDPAEVADAAADCGLPASPDAFATRVLVFDEMTDAGNGPETRVPAVALAEADPTRPICLTGSDGRWTLVTPQDASGGEQAGPMATSTAAVINDVVFVTADLPPTGSRQWVLYTTESDGVRLRAIDFCSRLPDTCPATFARWSADQLTGTARRAASAFVLAILGGWLLALSMPGGGTAGTAGTAATGAQTGARR